MLLSAPYDRSSTDACLSWMAREACMASGEEAPPFRPLFLDISFLSKSELLRPRPVVLAPDYTFVPGSPVSLRLIISLSVLMSSWLTARRVPICCLTMELICHLFILVSPLLRKNKEIWFCTVSGVRSSGSNLLTARMRSVALICLPDMLVACTVPLIRLSSAIESEP